MKNRSDVRLPLLAIGALAIAMMAAVPHQSGPARGLSPKTNGDAGRLESERDRSTPGMELRPRADGSIRVDADSIRRLVVGESISLSPLRGVEAESFRIRRSWTDGVGARIHLLDSTMYEESQGVLVEYEGRVAAWIHSPAFGESFEWRFLSMGQGRMVPEPRAASLPGCGGFVDQGMGPARLAGDDCAAGADPNCVGCSERIVDVAFFYTSRLRRQVEDDLEAGGQDPEGAHDSILLTAVLDAAATTAAMDNSELPYSVGVVLVEEVAFEETGDDFLGRFIDPADGAMDGIHDRRDEVYADICTLLAASDGGEGYCGRAAGDFNTVVWSCMPGLTFAHELGHNLGCCHAAGDGGGCGEETPCVPWEQPVGSAGCCMPDQTVFPDNPRLSTYNHGWRWVETSVVPACVHTIMAYGRVEPGQSAQRIPHFSNPEVDWQGQPTGSPEDSSDLKWADNARAIRENFARVSANRCRPSLASPSPKGETSRRLVASDLQDADFFGISVATNGEALAVGASHYDYFEPDDSAGAVFLFEDPLDEPDAGWIQTGKITPREDNGGDRLGDSVAMHEDLLVIGAPYASRIIRDPDTDEIIEELPLAGRVSIWQNDGAGCYCWLTDLQPEELRAFDEFGTSVAVSGGLVAIGAPLRDTAGETLENAGAVWVYRRVGDAFELIEVLEGQDGSLHGSGDAAAPGGRFGSAVAAGVQPDGNVMVLVGAPREGVGDLGKVHPFRYVEVADGWESVAGSPIQGVSFGGAFGASLAIEGGDAIVGAPESIEARGRAVIYRVDAENLDEVEVVLMNGNARPGDRLGASVAISSTYAVIGVPGRDYVVEEGGVEVELENLGLVISYKREPGNPNWGLHLGFRPQDLKPGDGLGASSAVAGWYLISGSPTADDGGPISGVVYTLFLEPEIIDCNENGIDDSLDILIEGGSRDHNANGIPDECEEGSCRADLNQDGVVSGGDLGLLLINWGMCPEDPDPDAVCLGDLDLNGTVNGGDLGIFCSSWGLTCEEPAP